GFDPGGKCSIASLGEGQHRAPQGRTVVRQVVARDDETRRKPALAPQRKAAHEPADEAARGRRVAQVVGDVRMIRIEPAAASEAVLSETAQMARVASFSSSRSK